MFGWATKVWAFIGIVASSFIFIGAAEQARVNDAENYWAYAQSTVTESLDDFSYLGDEHLAQFVGDAGEEKLDCELFEYCIHVELFTLQSCEVSSELKFRLLDDKDAVIKELKVQMAPLPTRHINVMEIGTNIHLDSDYYFTLQDFSCTYDALET
jgi:hypothetical protein